MNINLLDYFVALEKKSHAVVRVARKYKFSEVGLEGRCI